MGFGQAISAGFSNYVNFSGRASRSEYWYWILFIVIADIVAAIIDQALGMQLVTGLFGLVTIIPNIAVSESELITTAFNGSTTLPVNRNRTTKVASAISAIARGNRCPSAFSESTFIAAAPPNSAGEGAGTSRNACN